MMGMEDLFKATLGDFPEGDIEFNTLAAKAMVRAGLAVLLIEPGGKKPLCTLTARQAVTADNAAQKEAREGGTVHWDKVRHPCGVYHAITDIKELSKAHVKAHLENGANLAVVPGQSPTRVIVVDLDTREERRGFLEDWAAADPNVDTDNPPPMTVTSPGVLTAELPDQSPVWIHKDGGHFWFTLPEGAELPEYPGKLKGASGWTVYYGSGYVLVPPSVRPEGPYRLTGATVDAPAWLLDAIRAGGTTGSAEDLRERIRNGEGDTGIDEWSARTSWADLCGAYGYTPTGQLDSCGCPTWTRPGSPAHAKSATTHEVGCPQYITDSGHGPIHAWSDALEWGGKKTVTKLTFLAHEGHDGSMSAAMASIGVAPAVAVRDDLDFLLDEDEDAETVGEGESSPKGEEGEVEPDSWTPRDLAALLAGDLPVLEPTLLPRSDGRALFYAGKVHSLHGESESGKSLVLMGEAARLMKAGEPVLWITFDSDEEEDVGRALRFGATAEEIVKHLTYIRPEVAPASSPQTIASFKAMLAKTYTLAVIDGVVDAMGLITGGQKGDPNEVFSLFFRVLPKRIANRTGAATVMVDHVPKDAESRGRFAIGAQAKMAAITGAAYVCEPDKDGAPIGGGVGAVVLRVGKDRPKEVRRYCGPRRARDRTQEAARITFDDTGEFTVMTVDPPVMGDPMEISADGTPVPIPDIPFAFMQAVSELLEDRPDGMVKKDIEAAITGKNARVRLAMNELVRLHYVREDQAGAAKVLTLLVPYYVEYGDCDAEVSGEPEAA